MGKNFFKTMYQVCLFFVIELEVCVIFPKIVNVQLKSEIAFLLVLWCFAIWLYILHSLKVLEYKAKHKVDFRDAWEKNDFFFINEDDD